MVIAQHILEVCAEKLNKPLRGFSQASRELLLRYSYPGNVRELENMVERAVALSRDRSTVQPTDLCGFQSCPYQGGAPQDSCGFCLEGLTGGHKKKDVVLTSLASAREGFEKDYITSVLSRVEGSRTTASKILGLSRKALWEKCKRYGIPSAYSDGESET